MRTDSYRMVFCWDEHFFILFSNIFILFSLVGRVSSTIFASPHTQDCINSSDVKPTQCSNRLPTRERNALFKWPGLLLPVSEKCRSSQKDPPPLSAGVTLNSFSTKWSWVEPKTGVYCVCISQPSCLYIYNATDSLWKDRQQTLSKFDDSLKLESKLTFVLIKHPTAAVKQTRKKANKWWKKKLHAKQLYFYVSEGISYFFFKFSSHNLSQQP